VIRNFLSGQYGNALRVIAFNATEGRSQDVLEDVAHELLDRVYDADDTLSEATKRFIDLHVTTGVKRPPGAVGIARTNSVGPQEGMKAGSTSQTGASILARWASGHEGSTSRPVPPS
jgi:hypothetical protein